MPTYEYECTRGCRFEIEQSIKDEALKRCPKAACPKGVGGVAVHRLISAANFILKGGGWYSDGYSGKGGAKDSGGSDSASSSKSGDASSKSDSGSKPDSGSKSGSSAATSD